MAGRVNIPVPILRAHRRIRYRPDVRHGLVPRARCRDQRSAATGKLVLPGGIDPHVHLGLRPGMQGSGDYSSGSRAALAGGVTTIANFVTQVRNEATAAEEVKREAIAR